MKFDVLYAGEKTTIDIPESCNVQVVEPQPVDVDMDPAQIVDDALESPIDSPSFEEFIASHDSFLVIVNDYARRTPTPEILKVVLLYLEDVDFKIIVASGTHAKPTEKDLREQILGQFYEELKDRVILHDCKNDEMVNYGETSRGTPLKFNKTITEFDAIIAINSIEPHYFAGYTGGRKSILPGIAEYMTVERNHSMALDQRANVLALKGNPLHEDMKEAVGKVVDDYPTFGINVVQDGEGRIVGAVAGDIFKQLYKGAELAEEIYAPSIENKVDLLLSVVYPPLDHDLYQGAKGFENTKNVVRDGGIMALMVACPGGIGNEEYTEMMQCADSVEGLVKRFEEMQEHYELGAHKIGSIPPFLANKELWMVTEMSEETVESINLKKTLSPQAAVDMAYEKLGPDMDVLIVRDSGNVVPRLSE